MDYDTWLKEAKQYINTNIQYNEKFIIKNLFNGNQWETLSKGERISFGRYFSELVKTEKINGVKKIERKANNHSQYIKVRE